MSETEISAERDGKGRFQTGHKAAGPGRPKGARSKLGEAFLLDLQDTWQRHGAAALERVAVEQPEVLIKTIAGLLPRDLNLNATVGVNVTDTLMAFRLAVEQLGNVPPARLPKLIDARKP